MRSFTLPDTKRKSFCYHLALHYQGYIQRGCNAALIRAAEGTPARSWEFRTLTENDNGLNGGFLVPILVDESLKTITMKSMNGWSGEMSREAAGICVTQTCLSLLSFRAAEYNHLAEGQRVSDQFHRLRLASYNHKEAAAIVSFLD